MRVERVAEPGAEWDAFAESTPGGGLGHAAAWHRVLRADGTCAPHVAQEQAARLRAEGILLVDGRLPKDLRP